MDLIIRNGDVIDGTGAPARQADVAIEGDRIAAVEPGCTADARRVIDASGLVIAPGFIDAKTHSDFSLLLYPRAESRVHQGVTTELVGSCGFTAAPVPPGRLGVVADYLAAMGPGMQLAETSFPAYLDAFPATSVNVATQVGHNTLRTVVMGLDNRAPTADEQAAMERLAEEALEAGAFGVSSGPFTAPGAYAKPAELEAFAKVATRHGARYATHLRDEAANVLDAVDEVIAAAERTGARTRIVHVKISGTTGWGGAPRLIARLEAARRRGLAVDCDHYPYTTAVNPVRNLLPAWMQDGGAERFLARLADPAARHVARTEIAERGLNAFGRIASWDAVRISTSPGNADAVGRSIAELAAAQQCDPVDALCAVLARDRGATRALITAMDEADVAAFVACPWILVGSDGRAVGPGGPLAKDLPHPRFYGTFPRVLGHYVRERGLLTLPEAVHKMTGATAAAIGLGDRGVLRRGAKADIAVFDPKTIADLATFDEPRRYPSGVAHVIVNGVSVVDAGAHTGALPGCVLRRAA